MFSPSLNRSWPPHGVNLQWIDEWSHTWLWSSRIVYPCRSQDLPTPIQWGSYLNRWGPGILKNLVRWQILQKILNVKKYKKQVARSNCKILTIFSNNVLRGRKHFAKKDYYEIFLSFLFFSINKEINHVVFIIITKGVSSKLSNY